MAGLRFVASVLVAVATLSACSAIPGVPAPDNGLRGAYRLKGKPGLGSVFMSGSGEEPPSLLQKFRELAGGVNAKIRVAGFAGGLPNANAYREQFIASGCKDVELVFTPEDVKEADGVYVVGGQTGAAAVNVGPYAAVLKAAWRAGAVIGGHSAGAMLWGDQMVVSGEARAAMAKGVWTEGGGLELARGISLIPGAIVDPHFSERGRFPRLWVAVGATNLLGIGVDEATAAIWTGDGKLTAAGAGTVTLIRREPDGEQDAARVTVLGDGRSLDLADWGVARPE